MASAAAVAANQAVTPPRNNIDEDSGRPGEVTSAIGSTADALGVNGNLEDEDDDVPTTARRRGPAVNGADQGVGDGALFGDEEDGVGAEPEKPARRQLDDEELDSADDMDRTNPAPEQTEEEAPEFETQEKITMDVELSRQPLPEPSDGELYLLKIPNFMEIEPSEWDHQTFQPPTTDHHSNKPASATFSAYNTALTAVRWRHSPSNPSELQSNARILRWSDGSLTLQLASEPTVQYEMDGKALAPPQRNPVKPTPVSVHGGTKGGRQGTGAIPGEKYDQSKDAFTYLILPHESTATLRVVQKATAGLSIRHPDNVQDDAVERLEAALANATNATKVNGAGGVQLIDEDPEAARRRAEDFMRQKVRENKRRETAIERENERSNRVLGRSGLSAGRYGGLNVGMLEDDELDAGVPSRGRVRSGATPKKSRKRRSSVYSSDEDMGRRHFTSREDEYDQEDDFVAPSDEEELMEDDDEDPDDGIVEEPSAGRERTPKRDRPVPEDAGGDEDAEGEPDDEIQQARTKRRRVVEDEEEE